jgi:uncharacterized protein DUF4383
MVKTPPLMAVQGAAIIVAGAFLVVGVLGFLPVVTTHHDMLQFAGHHSGARLFGVFAVSILHNLMHMAFGLVGLAMARTYALARAYFLIGGLAYLGLWGYGMLVDRHGPANWIPVNNADNWLHFGLGIGMVVLGLTLAGQHDPTKSRRRRTKVPT